MFNYFHLHPTTSSMFLKSYLILGFCHICTRLELLPSLYKKRRLSVVECSTTFNKLILKVLSNTGRSIMTIRLVCACT